MLPGSGLEWRCGFRDLVGVCDRKLGRFQPMLGRAEIGGMDVKSRDIPAILLGLQGLYLNEVLREAVSFCWTGSGKIAI